MSDVNGVLDMACYDYQCTNPECASVQEETMSISSKDGAVIHCKVCGALSQYIFTPSLVHMSLKGDGWPSKTIKEKSYRAKRSIHMAQKQRDHVEKPTLQPNFNGQATGSWADAQTAAHDAGKNHTSYDNLVAKEKSKKLVAR